ncbi:hypothetical protein SLEP1_g14450 [Rubroshorea leprosula]|uniref:Uncharacterized protein n=1 Tax=Rubroshorea leprosula TaxID=152421 RepID=A0AAV5IUN1_9ROSI|nr:hypothetical protein SLEP1_g14450 [Rubroshorea leprosula]
MSSEGTLSVGREGEVGSLSSSLSSTSSSSSGVKNESRTSVSGGSKVQKYSTIPTNILEVDDCRDRCYGEREEVVGDVIGYKLCWKSRGELGYLVENYGIPPHVLVRPAKSEERAYSALKDHWMPLYVHYLVARFRFPIPKLLVALLKKYGIGLIQLILNGVRLVVGFLVYYQIRGGGSEKEKGWFYSTPWMAGGRSRNLIIASSSSIKGWKEKFFFADDTEWGRRDGEVEELNKWKGKKLNPNKYQLGEVETDEVERLDKVGRELVDIMYLTSPNVVESSGIYERSSLKEMNRLRAGGKVIRLPEKRSMASAPSALEERIDPSLREVKVVTHRKGKSSIPFPRQTSSFLESDRIAAKRFINSHFPKVDLQRAKDEMTLNGGAGVVRHALEVRFEFFDCLLERVTLAGKNEELSQQKEGTEKSFDELILELEKVKEKLATSKKAVKLEEKKKKRCEEALTKRESELAEVVDLCRLPTLVMAFIDCRKKVKAQNPKVDVTNITFSPEEARVEKNKGSKTAKFHLEIKLKWERDDVGKTIFPPILDYEFVTIDEEEVEVPRETKVVENVRNEEVDQQHHIID